MSVKKQLLLLIFSLCTTVLHAQASFTSRMEALLEDRLLETSEAGIAIFDLTAGKPLFNYQDKKLYRPASTEKLITAITGLFKLGINHRFETSLYYSGEIKGSKLEGDLFIEGGFDSEFGEDGMNALISQIEAVGIKQISGKIYGDTSMMDSIYWGPGWSWDDNPYGFQPYLSPLTYCKGAVEIIATPRSKGAQANLRVSPVSSFYTVDNQTRSHSPSAGKFNATRNWLEGENHIVVSGNVDSPRKECLNIYTAKDMFMQTFIERLKQKGISVNGYAWKEITTSNSIHLIGKHSHSLLEILKQAMKKSDNLSAEAIFFHLAQNRNRKKNLNWKDGTDAINAFVKEIGLDARQYKIADGSGVSLYNYVSPELLITFLQEAYKQKNVFEPLWSSLPVAGVDGTLANRMKEGRAYANVRAKTGSVTGISSLAGYVKAANGHQLAFVIINQNVLDRKKAHAFQDGICEMLSNYQ